MGKTIFQYLFIGLIIICLTIFYNYVSNPLALLVWGFTGDGYLFEFCMGAVQIALYNLILHFWKIFRNRRLWIIVFTIQIMVLAVIVQICFTDKDIEEFFYSFADLFQYGTVSLAFVLTLLELGGITIFCILSSCVESKSNSYLSMTTNCIWLLNILILVGGIVYYRNYDKRTYADGLIYMTPDGEYYVCQQVTEDSIYVQISDNASFNLPLSIRGKISNEFPDNILVKMYPQHYALLRSVDSLLVINDSSNYTIVFEDNYEDVSFLPDSIQPIPSYWFWFNTRKKPLIARFMLFTRNGDLIKYKNIQLRSFKKDISKKTLTK